jgi:hypothetical protein
MRRPMGIAGDRMRTVGRTKAGLGRFRAERAPAASCYVADTQHSLLLLFSVAPLADDQ